LWKDEHGIDTIPLKLVVYLVLVGIIIALTAIGLKNAGPPMDGALMERQLGGVKSGIELMQSGYARDLSDNGDVIYYKLRGDGKRLIQLQDPVHIREGELVNGRWLSRSVDGLGQAVVLTGGSQSVTFELVYDRGTTYTLSHLTTARAGGYMRWGGL